MKLLQNIIDGVTVSKEPLSDILRQCLVLAFKLKNDALKTWVEHELNGYSVDDELPDYRKSIGRAKGLFLGPFGQQIRDQPLASGIMKPEHQHWATDIRLRQPVAAYEAASDTKNGMIEWPADLVVFYQEKFIDGMALNRAYLEVPASTIAGLKDTIRTRVLTFALQIQDELPEDTEKAVEQLTPARVDQIVHYTIFGGTNVFGNVQEVNAPVVIAGDVKSLEVSLKALGISDTDFKALEASLKEDGSCAVDGPGTQSLGKKTLDWIGTAAKTVAGGALKISGSVAEEAIKAAVMKYLGLAL